MIYADELDDREVGRVDMAALLDEDPRRLARVRLGRR